MLIVVSVFVEWPLIVIAVVIAVVVVIIVVIIIVVAVVLVSLRTLRLALTV